MRLRDFLKKFPEIRAFMGGRVAGLFLRSSFVGFLVFGIESSFILVLQGFLRAMGLVDESKLQLPHWFPHSVTASIALLGVFGVLRGTAYFMRSYLGGVTHQAFIRLQRSRILEYALHHADKVSTHDVVTVFTERVNQAGGVLYGLSGLALTVTSSFLLFCLGLRLAPGEMLIGIALLSVFLFPLKFLNVKIREAAEGNVRELERTNQTLVLGIRHHLFLKIYHLVRSEVERGKKSLENFENLYRRYYLVSSFKFALPMTVGIVVICIITYCSLNFLHTPSIRLVSFFYIFIRVAQGASDINSTLAETRLQIPGFMQLFEWYDRFVAHAKAEEGKETKVPDDLARSFEIDVKERGILVEIKNLTFAYPGQAALFSALNLSVKRGEVLVVQGESGVGKSTLLSLMLGLNQPTAGEILINGFPVSQMRPLLSRYIAYVGPEAHLIAGTVRENLLYGHFAPEQVTESQIWSALRQAQLEGEVRALALGLNEPLNELTQLSTGQKQRLGIARAILRNPAWLVLDEASANLDAVTEQNFVDSLKTLLPALTTVVISHKPSFNKIATQHFLMKRR